MHNLDRVVMLPAHMFNFLIAVGVLAVVVFQIWLTVSVFRSSAYEREQKIRQAQLIWLLPVIGATLVFSVLRESNASEQSSGATADRSARRVASPAQRATARRDPEDRA